MKHYSEDEVATIIRIRSVYQETSLDLQTHFVATTSKVKKFFAKEDESIIQLTRIRSLLSRYCPKVIIRFDKSNLSYYQIRFSIFSTVIMTVLLTALLYNLMNYLVYQHFKPYFGMWLSFNILYFVLSYIEIKKTKRSIKDVISDPIPKMVDITIS